MNRTQLAAIRDGAMGHLNGEPRYAALVSHYMQAVCLGAIDQLRRCVNEKGAYGKAIRAVVRAYDEEMSS